MRFVALVLLALLPRPSAAEAPAVVELYTSQGCSACKPADALLAELAARDDVVALGLHVDYWDYIGWADPFALPKNADRQRRYAQHAGERMIYTPQVVIDGAVAMPGNRRDQVLAALDARLGAAATGPDLSLVAEGGALMLRAGETRVPGEPLDVVIATYDPARQTHITAGENAGGLHDYANVVTALYRVHRWDGEAALRLPLMAEAPMAVLLQRPGQGEIVAAAKID